MFILELTHRSWAHSEENKRRTLQRNDIAAAITRTDIFDFLVCTRRQHPVAQMHSCQDMHLHSDRAAHSTSAANLCCIGSRTAVCIKCECMPASLDCWETN